MSGGQEKNFSTLGPKLRGNKAQHDYGDKQRQICIEVIDYREKGALPCVHYYIIMRIKAIIIIKHTQFILMPAC